jgi:septal ring factor EnvC (AmiA/AmiB activator)
MEDVITQLAQNGGPLGVIAAGVVYLIIYFQRKQTSEKRNDDTAYLQKQIDELTEELHKEHTENQLLEKDVKYLLSETAGIKEDIKEMKNTLNSMALALERIAAKYESK